MKRSSRPGVARCAAIAVALAAAATAQDRSGGQSAKPLPPRYAMDYGPYMSGSFSVAHPDGNQAVKGLAVALGPDRKAGMLFDTELLRWAGGWVGGFLELRGTQYDGAHGPTSRARGEQWFATPPGQPGWAHEGRFTDPREIPYGPLPRDWGRYRGLYLSGQRVVVSYTVEGCEVLESPLLVEEGGVRYLARDLRVGPSKRPLRLLVADAPALAIPEKSEATAAQRVAGPGVLHSENGKTVLDLPASNRPREVRLAFWRGASGERDAFARLAIKPGDVEELTHGGPARWTPEVTTHGRRGDGDGAWVVDTLTVPYDNPWHSRMRIGAVDFFSDGRAAVSTWNGDVWIVSGIDDDLDVLHWKRFATGLFDPLGLHIVDDVVHTLGRDQITRLHDLDGDGEADFYECFNNDVLITGSFHEFAFDLQTDAEGNFYFSKAGPVRPGGRGFDKIIPHHGCILKVAKDGSRIDVMATGLRAPNGMCVSPNGELSSGDNEGTWTPRCRINWSPNGTFFGCMDTAHRDPLPKIYDLPICWMPMEVDNSSGGQVWVTTDKWGPFQGEMLHLSYGTSSLFRVLRQEVDGITQGGVVRFPLTFVSSCMRGRFHPIDHQLYVVGLKGWQTNASKLGGFQRVRYTGRPAHMPTDLEVLHDGLRITFTEPLDPETANDPESYTVDEWDYVYSDAYGSPEVSTIPAERAKDLEAAKGDWNSYKHHDPVKVSGARLSDDGRTVFLAIEGIKPVMQMRIRYDVDAADGGRVRGAIYNSIHRVPKATGAGGH